VKKQGVFVSEPNPATPYSPGIISGDLMFVSGQVPMNPETRQIVEGEFEEHVRQCLQNVEAVLRRAGLSLNHCIKVVVFLKDMDNFGRLNAVYNEHFAEPRPARSCVQVARLPLDVQVEIEAIATLR